MQTSNLFKHYEVLMSVIVSAPSPTGAITIVKECFQKQVLVVSSHANEVDEIQLPHRRHADNRHELQMEMLDDINIPHFPETVFTGSGAELNEPSILPLQMSEAVKE